MLVKRAGGSAWGWDADAAEPHFSEERGPAVIPFRTAPVAKPLAKSAAKTPDATGQKLDRLGLLLESDAPAEPWPQRPVLRQAAAPARPPATETRSAPAPLPEAQPSATAPAPKAAVKPATPAPAPGPEAEPATAATAMRAEAKPTGLASETRAEAKPAVFPRISRAESSAPPAAEPFRAVLQRYADDHAAPAPQPVTARSTEPAATKAPAERRAAAPPTPRQQQTPARGSREQGTQRAETAAEQAYTILTGIGLSDAVAEAALLEAVRVMPAEALAQSDRLIEVALARLVAGLPKGPPLTAALAGCQVFFIGPAGAGKTTALLKAAMRLRDAGVDVGIVGADLSRIGAREQLTRYGELLRLPVSAAYSADELAQQIAAAPPGRVLLIDTAASGLGPRTPRPLQSFAPELAALLAVAPRRVPVLVLPANARDADLARLGQLARALGAVAATITRLDDEVEAPVPPDALPAAGLALNALAQLHLPPLLCCSGRDVLSGHAAPSAMALAVAALETAALG